MTAGYLAANPVEAEIVKDYLAGFGVPVSSRGIYAANGVGDLPPAGASHIPATHIAAPAIE